MSETFPCLILISLGLCKSLTGFFSVLHVLRNYWKQKSGLVCQGRNREKYSFKKKNRNYHQKKKNPDELHNWDATTWWDKIINRSYAAFVIHDPCDPLCVMLDMQYLCRNVCLPEQRTPWAMRPHMKLAQYSHQCGPRKVCTWSLRQHGRKHSHTGYILQVIQLQLLTGGPPLWCNWTEITLWS